MFFIYRNASDLFAASRKTASTEAHTAGTPVKPVYTSAKPQGTECVVVTETETPFTESALIFNFPCGLCVSR